MVDVRGPGERGPLLGDRGQDVVGKVIGAPCRSARPMGYLRNGIFAEIVCGTANGIFAEWDIAEWDIY